MQAVVYIDKVCLKWYHFKNTSQTSKIFFLTAYNIIKGGLKGMIMPVSAAPISAKPMFRGTVKNSEVLEEAVKNFTKMERMRWDNVKSIAEKTNDNKFFQIYSSIQEIGKTIIKTLVINQNDKGDIVKEVYRITKGGTVFMYDWQSVSRTILETFENIYLKKEKI